MHSMYRLVRSLGITTKYKGYYCLIEALKILTEKEEKVFLITKDLYPVLARRMHSKPENVEHNIRTVVQHCWEDHREALEQIAGCRLTKKPTNAEFLDMLLYRLRDEKNNRENQGSEKEI